MMRSTNTQTNMKSINEAHQQGTSNSSTQTNTREAVLAANWARSLDILEAMGPGQSCVVSNQPGHTGRTALHMAAFVKPRETATELYQMFWDALVAKAVFLRGFRLGGSLTN